jgi:signal transduction histidine kinase/ActR/RegA family two-component response regulator
VEAVNEVRLPARRQFPDRLDNRMHDDADELARRTARAADHARENLALLRLARAQTGSRDALLQAIANEALALCNAGSAGISLLEGPPHNRSFRWLAVAGSCAGLQGKSTAWNECPCGVTLDAGRPRLFVRPEEQFGCLRFAGIDVHEGIVVPIPSDSGQLGAIWAMSHDAACRFDGEHARVLSSLAVVAGAALTMANVRDDGAESDRRHNEFIAMLGRELRNPLAPIDGAISAAKRLCAANEKADAVLTIAQRQMKHLRTLVDDLLDAARLKHGKLAIKLSDTSLNEITFDAVSAVKHHLESRRHTLKLSGLDAPVHVRADHVRLSQVLGNLLLNAAKYTPAGGKIELSVRTEHAAGSGEPGCVVIEVRDNGIGIDPSIQPYMFELFAQSTCGSARSEGGLGIGLAVAKRLVELHHGSIAIQSGAAGAGTLVTVRLPILRSAPAQKPAMAMPQVRPTRLLLADDNRDALEVLSVLLELEGHHVSATDNGHDAVRLIGETHPEVAIIDVGMPDMDGFDVARAVRADPRLDDVTLVALTGYASESNKSRALAAGFDYHLTKPLSLEKLQHILENRTEGRVQGIV